jgi:pimeloyl-ACP methyl ester carboxylesterase
MPQKTKIATHTIQVGNRQVRYQVAGEGEPIILVHGLSASTLWWRRNVPDLARHYRVYLVNLPGFGSMHFPRDRFVLTNAASWLSGWMEAIGLKRAHLVGHSMGGYICMWIAAHHPEVVARLVLVAPAVMPRVRSVFGYLVPLVEAVLYTSPSFLPILSFDVLRTGPLTLLRTAHDMLTLDVHKEINAITAPTLLVWGENDTLVPPSLGNVLHKEMADAHLIILKKAAHVCMYDRPREFDAAVLAFLRDEYPEKAAD